MKQDKQLQSLLEASLRRCAPPLSPPDSARVNRVCERLGALRAPPDLPRPHAFARPFLRVAAGLALLGSAAVWVQNASRVTTVTEMPHDAAVPLFDDLNALAGTPALTATLASETDNLVSDLAALATVLNDRSLAILF